MKNKKIVIVIVVILFGGYLFLLSDRKNDNNVTVEPSSSQSSLVTLGNDYDFGDIKLMGGNVSHEFKVKNEGTEPIVIEKAYTSCMCTTAYIKDVSGERYGKFGMQGHSGVVLNTSIKIDPGETAEVEAVYDPFAHGPGGVGKMKRIIYLETNSEKTPRVELTFSGNVIN